jgi:hypothetical protein
MRSLLSTVAAVGLSLISSALGYVYTDPGNDFSCTSAHNPVVTLHGLGATYYEDINFLGDWLKTQGFCVYRLTYGAYENFPVVGGFQPINESAVEVANFITQVHTATNKKVDLVGHSEGAFMSLYVPKFEGVGPIVQRIVPIAPPTHGTSFGGLITLAETLGSAVLDTVHTLLDTVGCDACNDLSDGGAAVARLNDGHPVAQPGNAVTIIISKYDELVTPTSTSVLDEPGVTNEYVQDTCGFDPVGHIGEAYDLNVWNLVLNALNDQNGKRDFLCVLGSPGK